MVTAVRKESLLALARLCLTLGIKSFWLDCICIDQKSQLEKTREILNMGSYYAKAVRTLIFPYGLDEVGPPLLPNGGAPVWHSRAWTLQEEVMAGDKAMFVLYFSEDPGGECKHEGIFLSTLGNGNAVQKFQHFVDSGAQSRQPKSCLHLVPRSKMTSFRTLFACNVLTDQDARSEALRTLQFMQSQHNWTLWSALREMYRRQASQEEDLVYGILGLLGITLPPSSVRYGVGLRGALDLLAEAVHVDQRLLLTVVESYHGNFIDGYCSLPAFTDESAVPAAFMIHLRTLGTAQFSGHSGMHITAPAITVDWIPSIDESSHLSEAMQEPEQVLIDVLEERGAMDLGSFFQRGPTSSRSAQALAKIAPGTPGLELTLIAATQVDTPPADIFRKRGVPITTFCCLVCTDGGSVKHKVGLALVAASRYTWKMQRHLVA